MNPVPTHDPSHEAARARILRAAARLCTVHGYDGTSVREIAAAAGVTKPLVHYYFGSKEKLFATMLHESMEACHTATVAILERHESAAERLRQILRWHFARAREAPEIAGFIHMVKTLPVPLPMDVDRPECSGLRDLLVRLVREGQERGEFRSVDPAAVVVMAGAMVQAYVAAVLAGDLEEIPASVEDTVFDLIVHGVGAAPEPAPLGRAEVGS